jgi:RNA polymerase sigma-70 factor (ECF subfamily)
MHTTRKTKMTYRNSDVRVDDAGDEILLGRAIDGDTGSFAVLVRRYTPMMRAYARRILSGSADVDDVVQDAFISAWQQLQNVKDPQHLKSWLMRITSRKALDRVRSARPQQDLDDVNPPAPVHHDPVRQAEAHAGLAALDRALRQLPDAQRQTWVLREVGGYSYDEISDELGIPTSTVRGLLARARKDIITRMEQWR